MCLVSEGVMVSTVVVTVGWRSLYVLVDKVPPIPKAGV